MKWLIPVIISLLLLAPRPADADCTSPAKTAGQIIFNADHSILQYCDGSNWVAMGPEPTGNSGVLVGGYYFYLGNAGASCNTTCASYGGVDTAGGNYSVASTTNCSNILTALGRPVTSMLTGLDNAGCHQDSTGSQYRTKDSVFNPSIALPPNEQFACPCTNAGSGGCSNPTADPGTIIYNANHRVMQYCNGTDWVAMGPPDPTTACTPSSWTAQSATAANAWKGITYGNGKYVAVANTGTNRVMTSTDGVTWSPFSTPAEGWLSVTYGNGLFVAAGDGNGIGSMYSSDGETWTACTTCPGGQPMAITYGNGTFVIVSSWGSAGNRVKYSTDGINWTNPGAVSGQWKSVTYGNGTFVAVGYDGTRYVMTSPDGITWTQRTASENNSWEWVTYGNGLFVAVASSGTNRVMTSPDGITWTARAAAEANSWNSVTYGNGMFVAVSTDGTNRVMTSPNGINWTAMAAAQANTWEDVIFGPSGFVAVSSDGTNQVMTSSCSCASPARAEGTMIYNADQSVMQYCNGAEWVGAGEPSICNSCSGTCIGGYCWYAGNYGESCTTVCSTHGGYNDATRTYAGSSGSDANCLSVLAALAIGSGSVSQQGTSGFGCWVYDAAHSYSRNRSTGLTDEGTSLGTVQRACACNN